MSDSFQLAQLSKRVQDASLIAHHRFRQSHDDIDECLFAWKDQQSHQFNRSIVEPQNELFARLHKNMQLIDNSLSELKASGEQADALGGAAQSGIEPCLETIRECERKVELTHYYAEDARTMALAAQRKSEQLVTSLAQLGNPPAF